eukprot:TRINITY_DN74657_c0_g1_i1.p1 TRINITY_DN74657_c0_g1~~TRINITY_DN74657_c0_g1_i1.p1  ORF type:complete len:209 (-),score=4.82 TRINITY_DN74657_c0_g1_i1:378-1004(-)
MASNPQLDAQGVPVPFVGEAMVLRRDGIEFHVDKLPQTPDGKWKARGSLFLSNIRMVFVASPPHQQPVTAFDLPLLYMHNEKFNQPIFGANNISGIVLPVAGTEEHAAMQAPHCFTIYFMEGGVGTFLPLFFSIVQALRATSHPSSFPASPASTPTDPMPTTQLPVDEMIRKAYVDPNDPTTVYLEQPSSFSSQGLRRRNTYQPPPLM